MKTLTLSLLSLAATLLGCEKETSPVTLAIQGTLETTSVALSGPPKQLQRITGSGQLTGLGATTFEALSTLVLTPPPPFNLSGTAKTVSGGDTLFSTFTGSSTPQQDGKLQVVINHTISGGTGRFRQATGYFNGTSLADRTTPAGILALEGQVTYQDE